MKTLKYSRVEKPNFATLCKIEFGLDTKVILDFGKKDGGKTRLPVTFIADAIEHYLEHIIRIGLCHSKKDLLKQQSRKTSKK